MIEKAKDDSSKYLQKYGGPEACVALIEREQRSVKLAKIVKIIDIKGAFIYVVAIAV